MWYDTFARRSISIAMMAAVALTAACDDDEDDPPANNEPDIATMRVTVDETVVDFTGGCTPSVASVTIATEGGAVQASFLRGDGTAEPLVTSPNFELRVEPAERFTRIDGFSGTLSGGEAGTSDQVSFSLYHVPEDHVDFGPCSLTVDVADVAEEPEQ